MYAGTTLFAQLTGRESLRDIEASLSAQSAKLYHMGNCWRVELFFKWIKQHLRIKSFFGTSENAVKTRIWVAVSVYVLVAIVKKRLGLEVSLYTFLQVLSVTLFEKIQLNERLFESPLSTEPHGHRNQLILFDFKPDTSICCQQIINRTLVKNCENCIMIVHSQSV